MGEMSCVQNDEGVVKSAHGREFCSESVSEQLLYFMPSTQQMTIFLKVKCEVVF